MKNFAHLINKSKGIIRKIALCVGAIVIMMTSVMGLAGCDEAGLGDEKKEMPTYTREEYEAVFFKLLVEDYPQYYATSVEDYNTLSSINFVIYNIDGVYSSKINLTFYAQSIDNFHGISLEITEVLPSIDDAQNFRKELRASFPEDAFSTAPWAPCCIMLENLSEEDRIRAYKIFYDFYAEINPDSPFLIDQGT